MDVPRELLERLAPFHGIDDSEFLHCVWCFANGPHGECDSPKQREDHKPDCPWVLARELLGASVRA